MGRSSRLGPLMSTQSQTFDLTPPRPPNKQRIACTEKRLPVVRRGRECRDLSSNVIRRRVPCKLIHRRALAVLLCLATTEKHERTSNSGTSTPFSALASPKANGHDHGGADEFLKLSQPQQDVLLLHGPRQKYSLEKAQDVPELKSDNEILIQPQYPWVNGRDFAGIVVRAPRSPSRIKIGDVVCGPSTDYRDVRKAAYQEYLVTTDFNVARVPAVTTVKAGAAVGVAFVAAVLALGVSFGLDLSSITEVPRGPDLLSLARRADSDQIKEDVRDEVFNSITEEERPVPGDWIAIWGASATTGLFALQLAKRAGLRVIAIADVAKNGSRLVDLGADVLVDRLDTTRAVEIIRNVTGNKLRFALDTAGKESAGLLQEALNVSNTGRRAHLVGLAGLPPTKVHGVVQHNVPIKIFHDAPIVGEAIVSWLEELFIAQALELPHIEIAEGGLAGVNDALDRLRSGAVSAKRIVIPINKDNAPPPTGDANGTSPPNGLAIPSGHDHLSEFDPNNSAEEDMAYHDRINADPDRVKFAYWVPNVSGGLVISKIPQRTSWDYKSNVRYGQIAERVGFEYALSQIRFMAGYGADNQHESVSFSQAILHETKRLKVIAALLPGPWNPAVAAKQIASIDNYVNGRIAVNVVFGWFKLEFTSIGQWWLDHAERYRRGREFIECLRGIWTEESFTYKGDFYQFHDYPLKPKPVSLPGRPYPEIFQGGNSHDARDNAAHVSDYYFMNGNTLEGFQTQIKDVRERAEKAGRKGQVKFAVNGFVICRETEEEAVRVLQEIQGKADKEAVEGFRQQVQNAGASTSNKTGMWANSKFEDLVQYNDGFKTKLIGTPEQIADRILLLKSLGVSIVLTAFLHYEEELQLFGEVVLPLVRKLEKEGRGKDEAYEISLTDSLLIPRPQSPCAYSNSRVRFRELRNAFLSVPIPQYIVQLYPSQFVLLRRPARTALLHLVVVVIAQPALLPHVRRQRLLHGVHGRGAGVDGVVLDAAGVGVARGPDLAHKRLVGGEADAGDAEGQLGGADDGDGVAGEEEGQRRTRQGVDVADADDGADAADAADAEDGADGDLAAPAHVLLPDQRHGHDQEDQVGQGVDDGVCVGDPVNGRCGQAVPAEDPVGEAARCAAFEHDVEKVKGTIDDGQGHCSVDCIFLPWANEYTEEKKAEGDLEEDGGDNIQQQNCQDHLAQIRVVCEDNDEDAEGRGEEQSREHCGVVPTGALDKASPHIDADQSSDPLQNDEEVDGSEDVDVATHDCCAAEQAALYGCSHIHGQVQDRKKRWESSGFPTDYGEHVRICRPPPGISAQGPPVGCAAGPRGGGCRREGWLLPCSIVGSYRTVAEELGWGCKRIRAISGATKTQIIPDLVTIARLVAVPAKRRSPPPAAVMDSPLDHSLKKMDGKENLKATQEVQTTGVVVQVARTMSITRTRARVVSIVSSPRHSRATSYSSWASGASGSWASDASGSEHPSPSRMAQKRGAASIGGPATLTLDRHPASPRVRQPRISLQQDVGAGVPCTHARAHAHTPTLPYVSSARPGATTVTCRARARKSFGERFSGTAWRALAVTGFRVIPTRSFHWTCFHGSVNEFHDDLLFEKSDLEGFASPDHRSFVYRMILRKPHSRNAKGRPYSPTTNGRKNNAHVTCWVGDLLCHVPRGARRRWRGDSDPVLSYTTTMIYQACGHTHNRPRPLHSPALRSRARESNRRDEPSSSGYSPHLENAGYNTVPSKSNLKVSPFQAAVSEDALREFQDLIRLAKLGPRTFENTRGDDRKFGLQHDWATNAKDAWQNHYDWRKTEARINSVPNFKADVVDDDGDTYSIHFQALFSEKPDAQPLVFLHGWPGSFLEFGQILDLLKAKYSAADLPYHVVVPSLPGYGYSAGPSLKTNWATQDIARIVDKLMVGLGFGDGYIAQGGDLGSFTAQVLVAKHAACKASHVNFLFMAPPKDVSNDQISETEMKGLARAQWFSNGGDAYGREHGSRPATIGLVLSSSPWALFCWISEKFLEWTDQDPPLSSILDSVSLYWFTESFPRAIYPYRQYFDPAASEVFYGSADYRTTKPLGYSWFPLELAPLPKAWVSTVGNLVWHKQHESGGHFAAMEKPKELLADIEDFVVTVNKG
ncbi:hypothetical protein FH972_023456 [Carpinus fangiana]|uniref:Enoyl reductase (ER) domain-containing protein n=1 Tax=Carpinus fangiana TaxID=176857 RepID=A0A5N6KVR6_9ROSI|nr:hypothetical protein FH972_023456 [Carpinus fangiana]